MTKGTIGVTTENIFPIIKKFLYSDHEIFLRELVSNAVDATQKLKALAKMGSYSGDMSNPVVTVTLDADKKTITISDQGIGMTKEEIEKYINQIAFSGAEEFVDKYKDKVDAIIGHFGLGFYSSFMVSEKVEIITKSYVDGATAVKWECDGSPNYEISDAERATVGTDIILYIEEESKEFLEKSRIQGLLTKYCKFLPVRIAFGKKEEWKDGKMQPTDEDNIINNPTPAWKKKPADLTDEDYDSFYHELYPVADEPLFNIHLNVDYPFNLTGILYFPKIRSNIEIQKNKIQLYCNQVFVTDSVEGIVPDFLTLLHGVLDSPDIPLNVSRSYLQSDGNVKKISGHISKKVADRLQDIFKADRKQFEEKWDDLKLFITYGMMTDEKFYERAAKFSLFKNTDGKYFTYDEYKTLIEANQKDKHDTLIYLYTTNAENQHAYIEKAVAKGYDVLLFDGHLDSHFVNNMEQKFEKSQFVRVDSDIVEKLIQKDEVVESKLTNEQKSELTPVIKAQLPSDFFVVQFEAMSENEVPMVITQSEFMRRMKDMAQFNAGMGMYGNLPDSYNIVVNTNHPLIAKVIKDIDATVGSEIATLSAQIEPLKAEETLLKKAKEGKKDEDISTAEKEKLSDVEKQLSDLESKKRDVLSGYGKQNKVVKQMIDLALIANNMLKGEELTKFVKRSIEMIE